MGLISFVGKKSFSNSSFRLCRCPCRSFRHYLVKRGLLFSEIVTIGRTLWTNLTHESLTHNGSLTQLQPHIIELLITSLFEQGRRSRGGFGGALDTFVSFLSVFCYIVNFQRYLLHEVLLILYVLEKKIPVNISGRLFDFCFCCLFVLCCGFFCVFAFFSWKGISRNRAYLTSYVTSADLFLLTKQQNLLSQS